MYIRNYYKNIIYNIIKNKINLKKIQYYIFANNIL